MTIRKEQIILKWAIVDSSDLIATAIIDNQNTEEALVFKTRQLAKESPHYFPHAGDKIRKVTDSERDIIKAGQYSNL